jgi:hypothetical protein
MHLWYTHQPEARDERLAMGRRAHELACCSAQEAIRLRLVAHRGLVVDLLENQEIYEFEAALQAYEEAAHSLGSPQDIYWTTALRATETTMRGDLAAAEQLARGAMLRDHELDQISDGDQASTEQRVPQRPHLNPRVRSLTLHPSRGRRQHRCVWSAMTRATSPWVSADCIDNARTRDGLFQLWQLHLGAHSLHLSVDSHEFGGKSTPHDHSLDELLFALGCSHGCGDLVVEQVASAAEGVHIEVQLSLEESNSGR